MREKAAEAIKAILARANEKMEPSKDGADIDKAIAASRAKLAGLDTAGAQAILEHAKCSCIPLFRPTAPRTGLSLATFFNVVYRLMLMPGRNEILHDAIFAVPSVPDNYGLPVHPVPVEQAPIAVLRYTLPSRYCDSDKLMNFAWSKFGHVPNGVERAQAICNWVYHNIEYRYGSGSPLISAWDVVERGYGVCRDLAHVGVALCRALSLPARYVTGHVADIAVSDPGLAMDFHAYFEAFLGGYWHATTSRASAG